MYLSTKKSLKIQKTAKRQIKKETL